MPSTGSIDCLLVDEPLSAVLFRQILPFIRRKLCRRMPASVERAPSSFAEKIDGCCANASLTLPGS
jgi:hypothetical protein